MCDNLVLALTWPCILYCKHFVGLDYTAISLAKPA
jgi:hypothetical protein